MNSTRLLPVLLLVCAGAGLACGDPSGLAPVKYQLRTIDGRPVPTVRAADTARGAYDYVDSAAIEIVDDSLAWISLATHQVLYLENGDSLEGGWAFRTQATIQPVKGGLVLDYRSRDLNLPYGSDFRGVDTAMIIYHGLVIRGDSLVEAPRRVYRFER